MRVINIRIRFIDYPVPNRTQLKKLIPNILYIINPSLKIINNTKWRQFCAKHAGVQIK